MYCIRSEQVKIRKAHNCWGCGREFLAGSQLEANVCIDGGQASTSYWCPVCIAVIDGDWEEDGYGWGEIRSGDTKRWEEMRAKIEEATPNESSL